MYKIHNYQDSLFYNGNSFVVFFNDKVYLFIIKKKKIRLQRRKTNLSFPCSSVFGVQFRKDYKPKAYKNNYPDFLLKL